MLLYNDDFRDRVVCTLVFLVSPSLRSQVRSSAGSCRKLTVLVLGLGACDTAVVYDFHNTRALVYLVLDQSNVCNVF